MAFRSALALRCCVKYFGFVDYKLNRKDHIQHVGLLNHHSLLWPLHSVPAPHNPLAAPPALVPLPPPPKISSQSSTSLARISEPLDAAQQPWHKAPSKKPPSPPASPRGTSCPDEAAFVCKI